MRRSVMTGVGVVVVLLVTGLAAAECRVSDEREAAVALGSAEVVVVSAGAGSLRVEAREDLAEVRAHGTACASTKGLLEDIRIDATASRGRIQVETVFPNPAFGDGDMLLDLVVEVPAGVRVEVRDGSGWLKVSGVAGVKVEDGSGDIELTNIQGNVEVEDGSGELEIREVFGDVDVTDGSGEIEIGRVTGSVRVMDGSGEIEIERVDRDVRITGDGSGDIDITDVGGSVRIDEDGSGSIRVDTVSGDVVVGNDGSGGVKVKNVAGRVDIPRD